MMLLREGNIALFFMVQYSCSFHIHEHMTDEELTFYFGKTNKDQIKDSYDVGILRKTENNKVFGRIFEKNLDGFDDVVYELFALGEKITLNVERNDLLSKLISRYFIFSSDRSSSKSNLCLAVHPSNSILSRTIFLHLFKALWSLLEHTITY